MGVASWLVWREGPERLDVRIALWLYGLQLAVNALWAPLFFGLRKLLAGLVDILLLWVLVALTTLAFYRISNEAAALLLPYWAWVTFAAGLNALILRLNP
ncbi:MAG: tryptophan-rich sensory protein [Armatimonadetes bacterium]|nr:tryptophan-rich sensory protein [Armatimonadota bacterium]